jgi:hypothetical protein
LHVDAEAACQLDGVFWTRIVDEDETIGNSGRDIGDVRSRVVSAR